MDERQLRDSDWLDLRLAIPSFATRWQEIAADATYDKRLPFVNIGELTRFVARELLTLRPVVLFHMARALEKLYTQAAIRHDESLEGLLTVGFLESLLIQVDERGIPLTRIEPMVRGRRTLEHWERAVTHLKPGFHWEDGIGLVASHPRPLPVGTVEVRRGWADREARVLHLDARLVAGTLRTGWLIRRQISRDFCAEWKIESTSQRAQDQPNEYHLKITADGDEMFEAFELEMARLAFRPWAPWEIARRPLATPPFQTEHPAD